MLRRNTIYWHWKRGSRLEAMLYGWSARSLAWLRAMQAAIAGKPDRGKFADFSKRIAAVDRQIRAGTPIGEWFGPPVSSN
jgi:hypothetical protein